MRNLRLLRLFPVDPSLSGAGGGGVPEDRVEHVELAAFFDGGHDPLLIGPPVPAAPRHERQTTIKNRDTRLGHIVNSRPGLIAVHLSGGIVLYFCFQMWPTGLAT